MLCLKNHRQWIYSLLFVLSVAFISVFGLSSDSFAVEPVNVNIVSGNTYSNALISNCDSYYTISSNSKYLIIDSTVNADLFSTSSAYYLRFWFGYNISSAEYRIQPYLGYQIFDLTGWNIGPTTGSSPAGSCLSLYSNFTARDSFSITLTDSLPGSGSSPTGNIDITSNGTYDVTNYATATVNVENEIIQGDYHDDLVSINNSILIVAAVGLVIYFFYAIYRMLIGGRK